jgi:hypothetical protein
MGLSFSKMDQQENLAFYLAFLTVPVTVKLGI